MNGRFFVDSNVFLYAREEQDVQKSARARDWLQYLMASRTVVTNLQVLNEVANVLLKRGRMPVERVFEVVDELVPFGSQPISMETVSAARVLRFETGYAWWDCLLLASSVELGCRTFLSEDLHDGHAIRGLTVVNPFRHSPPHTPFH
jgi:predicted nucleic acid-binding protein